MNTDKENIPEEQQTVNVNEALIPPAEASADPDFIWNCDDHPGQQTINLSRLLAGSGELFRTPDDQMVWIKQGEKPKFIDNAILLEGFIRRNINVRLMRNGNVKGASVPSKDLSIFLKTPALQEFIPVVDSVTTVVTYGSDWEITHPGYNDGPEGEKYYYTGERVEPAKEPVRIREFLGALSFKDPLADATNTVALALTVLLRSMFQGCKPFAAVTANRSHAGKDTILDFASGRTKRIEISWGTADWALQNEAVSALSDPCVGFLTLGNVRAGNGIIESAFVERIVTSPDSVLQSSKRRGDGYSRRGDFVVGCSANQGRFSTDLMNRSLPIALELLGNLEDRKAPLGDLRNEYLPAHRKEIEAELCGMIENWKGKGRPLDEAVKHPMKEWARTIGGILKANGFQGFLSNWSLERSVQDCITEALGILAHAACAAQVVQGEHGDQGHLRVSQITDIAIREGVLADLIGARQGTNTAANERKLGIVLSGHKNDHVAFVADDGAVERYVIERTRLRIDGAVNPVTCYRFRLVE